MTFLTSIREQEVTIFCRGGVVTKKREHLAMISSNVYIVLSNSPQDRSRILPVIHQGGSPSPDRSDHIWEHFPGPTFGPRLDLIS